MLTMRLVSAFRDDLLMLDNGADAEHPSNANAGRAKPIQPGICIAQYKYFHAHYGYNAFQQCH